MPRRIRKPVHELSAADFEDHSCWVYASDEEGTPGQDESIVRPLGLDDLASETGQVFVQAAFMFPNGRIRTGFVTLNAGDDPSGHQPVMFIADETVLFYNGTSKPKPAELKSFLRPLRKVCSEPFPIAYITALQSPLGNPLASGRLDGFYWLADWRTGELCTAA